MFPLAEPPDLVLFDCDGVLVDSEHIANPILVEHLRIAGIDLHEDEVMRRYVGKSMSSVIEDARSEFGVHLDDKWYRELRAETDAAFRRGLDAIEGADMALEALASAGTPFCVASSGNPAKMQVTLGITGLNRFFNDNIFSAWEVPRGKPYPDLFLAAAGAMGASPASCVVIEDSLPGVEAGIAAGMRVLGYSPGEDRYGLEATGAHVFGRMKDVPALIGL